MTTTESDIPTFAAPGLAGRPAEVSRETPAPDPDFADDAVGDKDALDPMALLAEIAGPVVLDPIIVPHRFRPGWAVKYDITIDADEHIKRWRDQSTTRKGTAREKIDEVRMACLALATLGLVFIKDGVELVDDDGTALNFRHPAVWQNYGVKKSAEAVRAFYGNDPYLGATFEAVLAAAGVGEQVEALDPTQPSVD